MWNIKKNNKLVNITKKKKKSRLTDIENKLVITSREGKEGEDRGEDIKGLPDSDDTLFFKSGSTFPMSEEILDITPGCY